MFRLTIQDKEAVMLYVCNAFSLNMINPSENGGRMVATIQVMSMDTIRHLLSFGGWESYVGHADTANVFSDELEIEVPMNRGNLVVTASDELIVGQYNGPRLAEGTKVLPEGATIVWFSVRFV